MTITLIEASYLTDLANFVDASTIQTHALLSKANME